MVRVIQVIWSGIRVNVNHAWNILLIRLSKNAFLTTALSLVYFFFVSKLAHSRIPIFCIIRACLRDSVCAKLLSSGNQSLMGLS